MVCQKPSNNGVLSLSSNDDAKITTTDYHDNSSPAGGCLILVALLCIAISIGYVLGVGYGWGAAGGMLLAVGFGVVFVGRKKSSS